MAEEFEYSQAEEPQKKTNPWVIVLIILAVLLCCCILMLFVIPTILALLGPSVGDVFSNIIEEIGTPVP